MGGHTGIKDGGSCLEEAGGAGDYINNPVREVRAQLKLHGAELEELEIRLMSYPLMPM